MKKLIGILCTLILLLGTNPWISPVYAVCGGYNGTNSSTWTTNSSTGTAAISCSIDTNSTEAYDYSAGTDDATNGYALTINAGVTITMNSGSTLIVGKILATSGGKVNTSSTLVAIKANQKCFVADADSDLYSPTPNTCLTSAQAGYVRKNKLRGSRIDCGDGAAGAHPCDDDNATNCVTAYSTAAFTNTATGLSYDYNCNGSQEKQYGEAYVCSTCNNGTYSSRQNTGGSGQFNTTVACGAAGTYYTYTNATCLSGSGNTVCSNTTSTVTQACR